MLPNATALQDLMAKGWVWQGQEPQTQPTAESYFPSGIASLDKALGGGWLSGSMNELQVARNFIGELALVLPLLRRSSPSVWINPPAEPYAPGWHAQNMLSSQQYIVRTDKHEDALWALQQNLQAGCMGLVLAWFEHISASAIRKLQHTAQQQQSCVFIFTKPQAQLEARAYTNRLLLSRNGQGLEIELLKRRYGWPLPPFPGEVDGNFPVRRRIKLNADVLRGPW